MACNCLDDLREKAKEKYGECRLETDLYLTNDGGTFSSWPSLWIYYHGEKADGSPRKRESRIYVTPHYCPICGKRYDNEQSQSQTKP